VYQNENGIDYITIDKDAVARNGYIEVESN